jgi:hypothetical protein
VHAVGQHAGGHQDQDRAGPGEELAEVDLHRALVEQVAEHDRGGQPECRAEQRAHRGRPVPGGGLGRGPQEQRGLQALPADGQHRDDHQAGAAGRGRGVHPALEVAGQAAGGPCHPHHHPGDEADRDDRQHAPDGFLRLEAQPARAEGEQRTERQRDADRDGHATPDAGEQLAAVGLDEVGHEDHHDEGGLEPLAEPDQVVRQHGGVLALFGKAVLSK